MAGSRTLTSRAGPGASARRFAGALVRGARAACLESTVFAAGRLISPPRPCPDTPDSIFVLRNNDVGDLLVITPLFEALRRRFPDAAIVAGVGHWNRDVLRGNPHITDVMTIDAPWFNKYAPAGGLKPLAYLRSPQAADLARRRFDVGIDVLGSAWGSLLLMRAGIPCRLGVRGYAGGHTAASATMPFDPREHVGRSALRFAELLGATDLPASRPQIFLSDAERAAGEALWQPRPRRRVLIGPGAGLDSRRWPQVRVAELIAGLPADLDVVVTGGTRERALLASLSGDKARALADLSLRETFALAAAADLVICNSSMLMHAAAAFARPTIVVYGPASPPALDHDAQWGYPGTCVTLEREAGAADVLAAARALVGL
jgi:ADP-heptose:LPS heptosyltransferase